MIEKDIVSGIIDDFLQETDMFLVDLKISVDNRIRVFLDGDEGVPIKTCVDLSRKIESSFDREIEDFDLEVSSVGLDKPLQMTRQFKKNAGRQISFLDEENKKINAIIVEADDQGVLLDIISDKKLGKKKSDKIVSTLKMTYDQLKDPKVVPSFK